MRTPFRTLGGTQGQPLSREEKIEIIWENSRPHRGEYANRRQILMPGNPPKWRFIEALSDEELDGMMPEPEMKPAAPPQQFDLPDHRGRTVGRPPSPPRGGVVYDSSGPSYGGGGSGGDRTPHRRHVVSEADWRTISELQADVKHLEERLAYLEAFIDRIVGPMTTWNRPEDRD